MLSFSPAAYLRQTVFSCTILIKKKKDKMPYGWLDGCLDPFCLKYYDATFMCLNKNLHHTVDTGVIILTAVKVLLLLLSSVSDSFFFFLFFL